MPMRELCSHLLQPCQYSQLLKYVFFRNKLTLRATHITSDFPLTGNLNVNKHTSIATQHILGNKGADVSVGLACQLCSAWYTDPKLVTGM